MSADLVALVDRLELETAALCEALGGLDDEGMGRPTPSEGWSVLDQVTHLAYFDDAAAASLTGTDGFAPYLEEAAALGPALCDRVALRERHRSASDARDWWRDARATLCASLLAADPSSRVPWYGATMSVASMASARAMETWAHGQDVYDALGRPHPVTDALVDVARICARTRPNSYLARGMAVPEDDVAVVLTAPGGATWCFGEPGGATVSGDAVEFCLVATQRRHVDDTSLVAEGAAAREWLEVAQAFAGPPGPGRSRSGAAA